MCIYTKLISEINLAFPKGNPPTADKLCESVEDLDAREAIRIFGGRNVDGLSLMEIGVTSAEDLYSFTDSSIRYYIPAYLKYVCDDIKDLEYSIVFGMIAYFSPDNINEKKLKEIFDSIQIAIITKIFIQISDSVNSKSFEDFERNNLQKCINFLSAASPIL